jgi:hypothetical protein
MKKTQKTLKAMETLRITQGLLSGAIVVLMAPLVVAQGPDTGPPTARKLYYQETMNSEIPASPPLGMRYTVLRFSGNRFDEVDPGTRFRTGDRIRLSFELNDAAHLYVVAQGASGSWAVLFPSETVQGGRNRVEAFHRFEPQLEFVPPSGTERVFVVASRQSIGNLDTLIYALSERNRTEGAEPEPQRIAENAPIPDNVTIGLRDRVQPRDLVLETVENFESDQYAHYVVGMTGSAIAEFVLDHRDRP